jgi:hypothetical protein
VYYYEEEIQKNRLVGNVETWRLTIRTSNQMRWTGHLARMRDRRGTCRTLVGKHVGKKALGRPRRRWQVRLKLSSRMGKGGGHGVSWCGLG